MERALDEGDLAPNPDALLTVVQAAQWAGVPLSTIRKLMDEGLLRFEVLRQGEREVQRIRMVDLRERFPSEASHSTPTPKSGSAASSSGESGSPAANAAAVGAAEPADTRLGPRGFERGLALLSQQQEELREQCFDLRRRLTHTELERQRAMEALIRAQERFQPGALDPPQAWWKRPAWLAAAVAGLALVGWVGRSFQVLHAAVDQSASQWSTQARSYTDEQLAFQVRRSDGERRALAEKLERWEQDRQRLVQLQTEQAAILLEQRQALESALGGVAGQTQEVTEALAKALEEQKQWAQGLAQTDQGRWEQLRRESLGLIQSELAQQQAEANSWRGQMDAAWKVREQRALTENDRLLEVIERWSEDQRKLGEQWLKDKQAAEQALALRQAEQDQQAASQARRDHERAVVAWAILGWWGGSPPKPLE